MTERNTSSEIGHQWLIKGQELQLDTPRIVGILNVTPDSFSDGGAYLEPSKATSRALAMVEQGAAIIDVGGESTRPGSQPVSAEEETSRVLPIIEALSKYPEIIISIDTQKATVARAAVEAGAHIINDISGGLSDSGMLELVRESRAGYILMHMQGTPETMQDAPTYGHVLDDLNTYFSERLAMVKHAGIALEQIVLDPGIGFGKTLPDNLSLMGNMHKLGALGRPLLLGASRKSFIGMLDHSTTENRLGGSLAAVLATFLQGVKLFRVHDVHETRQLLNIFTAIQKHSD